MRGGVEYVCMQLLCICPCEYLRVHVFMVAAGVCVLRMCACSARCAHQQLRMCARGCSCAGVLRRYMVAVGVCVMRVALAHAALGGRISGCACAQVCAVARVRGSSRFLFVVVSVRCNACVCSCSACGRISSCACAYACQLRVRWCMVAAGVRVLRVALPCDCMRASVCNVRALRARWVQQPFCCRCLPMCSPAGACARWDLHVSFSSQRARIAHARWAQQPLCCRCLPMCSLAWCCCRGPPLLTLLFVAAVLLPDAMRSESLHLCHLCRRQRWDAAVLSSLADTLIGSCAVAACVLQLQCSASLRLSKQCWHQRWDAAVSIC
jgi:hypothetical protein